jgi:GT2 family glycosyltransferase
MRADVLREMGGFPEIPVMEDFEMARRLRRRGPIEIVSAPVATSARRWLADGTLRRTLRNRALILGYFLGVSTARLARLRNSKAEG